MGDLELSYLESSLGELEIYTQSEKVFSIRFSNDKILEPTLYQDPSPLMKEIKKQLQAYFSGKLRRFDLPLGFQGTPFQQTVWKNLEQIPYGETLSYKELAERSGFHKAYRAVGTANGRNPFWIVVPCHRVIASDGSIGGYGGGVWRKRYLLELESRVK